MDLKGAFRWVLDMMTLPRLVLLTLIKSHILLSTGPMAGIKSTYTRLS